MVELRDENVNVVQELHVHICYYLQIRGYRELFILEKRSMQRLRHDGNLFRGKHHRALRNHQSAVQY